MWKKRSAEQYAAEGMCFVEVIRLWDCDEQRWMPQAPAVIRFEDDDLLAWRGEDGCAELRWGPVAATGRPEETELAGLSSWIADDETCLTWRRDPAASRFAGEAAVLLSVSRSEEGGDSCDLIFRFEDGELRVEL